MAVGCRPTCSCNILGIETVMDIYIKNTSHLISLVDSVSITSIPYLINDKSPTMHLVIRSL